MADYIISTVVVAASKKTHSLGSCHGDYGDDDLCPGVFEYSGGLAGGCPGGQDVIDEQNFHVFERVLGSAQGESPFDVFEPVPLAEVGLWFGPSDPSEGSACWPGAQLSDSFGEQLGLIVSSAVLSEPMEGHPTDQVEFRFVGDSLDGGGQEFAEELC